jgi:hypothetical protein
MGLCKSLPLSGRLSKARGLPSCIRTTPITFPDASHSTVKVFVKSGVVRTEALHITSLSCSKDLVASGFHENTSFLVSAVKRAAYSSIVPNKLVVVTCQTQKSFKIF